VPGLRQARVRLLCASSISRCFLVRFSRARARIEGASVEPDTFAGFFWTKKGTPIYLGSSRKLGSVFFRPFQYLRSIEPPPGEFSFFSSAPLRLGDAT